MEPQQPSATKTVMTDLVLPSDTNPINNLFGGELLARMDRAACIAAERHSEQVVVTASVNHVHFRKPVPLGSVLTLEAKVSRAFGTSMEVFIDVWKEEHEKRAKEKVNEAIYTFVAVSKAGIPVAVPPIAPETTLEQERYDGALRRRQLSLILAGKLNPEDATELKALFS
jgi:acyl-CoA hydrolase